MHQPQQGIKESESGVICTGINRRTIGRFHHFKIPRRKFVPKQSVDCHQGFRKPELLHQRINFGSGFSKLLAEPFHRHGTFARGSGLFRHLPALYKAERIPDLVTEIPACFAQLVIEKDVVSGRCGKHKPHAHPVGAISGDKVERVGRITERFAHLPAEGIAHDTCEIHIFERHIPLELIPGYNHAGNPEEYDIRACHKVGSRIIIFDFFVIRVKDSVEQRYRPQPRAEPGVEAVLVRAEV